MYSVENKHWSVCNETAGCGYICLLSSPGHFDVLEGSDGTVPFIPRVANTLGISRHSIGASGDVWQCLQRNYSFQSVLKFPEQLISIDILNNTGVLLPANSEKDTVKTVKLKTKKVLTDVTIPVATTLVNGDPVASLSMH